MCSGYIKCGDPQAAEGDDKTALASYQKFLAITERLAQQDPGNAGWQRDLFYSQYVISAALEKIGDAAGALDHAETALLIAEKLSALAPTNATWQKDVKASREWVGCGHRGRSEAAQDRGGKRRALPCRRSGPRRIEPRGSVPDCGGRTLKGWRHRSRRSG